MAERIRLLGVVVDGRPVVYRVPKHLWRVAKDLVDVGAAMWVPRAALKDPYTPGDRVAEVPFEDWVAEQCYPAQL